MYCALWIRKPGKMLVMQSHLVPYFKVKHSGRNQGIILGRFEYSQSDSTLNYTHSAPLAGNQKGCVGVTKRIV